MTYLQELGTLRRLKARLKAQGRKEQDIGMAEPWERIVVMGRQLGVKYPYMLVLYPGDFKKILANDYSQWDELADIPI